MSDNVHTLREQLAAAEALAANLRESVAIVEFLEPSPRANGNGNGHRNARLSRREQTAAILEAYRTPKPWTHGSTGLGTLMRHGYLQRRGEHIVRTGKAFDVHA